jgi:hypothetical protein
MGMRVQEDLLTRKPSKMWIAVKKIFWKLVALVVVVAILYGGFLVLRGTGLLSFQGEQRHNKQLILKFRDLGCGK